MASLRLIAVPLARAFAAGSLEAAELIERGQRLLGSRPKWLTIVAAVVAKKFGGKKRPPVRELARYLGELKVSSGKSPLQASCRLPIRPLFVPNVKLAAESQPRKLETVAEVAAWLELTPGELDWFADRHQRNHSEASQKLHHYSYHWRKKRSGGVRLVEAPKRRLKDLHRKILCDILNFLPLHAAAHGFRHGRSTRTCVQGHVGHAMVLRMDLADFFPSIAESRVGGLLMWAGYPEEVARTLAAICTNDTPMHVLDSIPVPLSYVQRRRWEETFRRPHLPQGAPTSPALANLCAYRLDTRLTGLVEKAGAFYTRYADDLIFSGGESLRRSVQSRGQHFRAFVHAIALEEGFRIVEQKTRIMPQGVRQHAVGIVLNAHMNIGRDEFDRLKAILHNSAKHGPQSQNRDEHGDFRGHLLGRVAYLEALNPARGRKLRELFDRIDWS